MLRSLCATAVLQLRLAPALLPPGALLGAFGGGARREPNRAPRQMAVPIPAARPMPMAVPMDSPAPSRSSQLVALGFLALTLASLWRQENVVSITRVALDGLRSQQVPALDLDAADRPAMDPGLAWILDSRSRLSFATGMKQRQVAVQPFEYEVRDGESVQEIAVRFGTDVSALLWNNGLDGPDQVKPGDRLTILPVRGVLHLVKAGETLAIIAQRYGSRLADLLSANALDGADRIVPGQVIVVAGGSVPMPTALTSPDAAAVAVPVPASAPAPTPAALVDNGAASQGTPAPPAGPDSRDQDLPFPTGASDWQSDFIMSLAPGARESQRKTGVPSSVTLAQAILESDWGRSKLSRDGKNLFGIKAFKEGGTAGIYEAPTWEVYGGQNATVVAAFKAYTTLSDSIADHGRWFLDNSRYQDALAVKDDPRAFAYAINAAGYATDPAYAPKLIGLMDRFNLYAYDVQPGE